MTLPRSPLRGAIVGFGFIAEHGHLPAYAAAGPARFDILAVADACPARRHVARTVLPRARIYASPLELLDAERGRLDFVDVATPPCDHARIALDALARGCHVLCEKPLATTAADARAMTAMARETGRTLFPCHTYEHAPVVKAVQRILASGVLGRPRLVTLQTFRTSHAKGVSAWRRDWRRERRFSGGGVAMDHGSHTFYLAFDWLGGYPTSVTAKMSSSGHWDTEDNFSCAMTFPGATATAHLSWTAGVRKVLYTIHGERGALRVEDDDLELSIASEPTGGGGAPSFERSHQHVASDWMDASHAGWFRSVFDRFVDATAANDLVSRETEASVRCVELVTTAYASALDGSRERPIATGGWTPGTAARLGEGPRPSNETAARLGEGPRPSNETEGRRA